MKTIHKLRTLLPIIALTVIPEAHSSQELQPHGEGSVPVKQRDYTKAEKHCLTQNIFFESGNQNADGKIGVGFVVLNRSADKRWPTDLCDVVRDRKHGKQFSWHWDGKSDEPIMSRYGVPAMWRASVQTADALTNKHLHITDPTKGAFFYISKVAASKRALRRFERRYKRTVTLDDHIFYR